jgi:hypothetical protein
MKKVLLVLPLLCAIVVPGCVKSIGETTVRNDGTASCKMTVAYSKETFEKLKMIIAAQGGGEGDENVDAAIDAAFDDKKLAEQWKSLGIEVTRSAGIDKDGWKTIEVEGNIKNVVEYGKKSEEALKALRDASKDRTEKGPADGLSNFAKASIPLVPKFYKTDKADVAKLVLVPRSQQLMPDGEENPLDRLDEMEDDQREAFKGQLDAMRGELSLDDIKIELRVKVPGKILTVNGLKQEGEDAVIHQFLGADISLDTLKALRSKSSHSATFQFKPEEFKIPLMDEPKAETKPASRFTPKPSKDEEEKKRGEEDGDR